MKKVYSEPGITVISLLATTNIAYTISDGDILIDSDELEE